MSRLKNNHAPRSHPRPDTLTVTLNHHQAGRYAEAEAGYQRLIKSQPQNPDAWHLWGVLAAQQQQYENAVERIQRALALKPHEPVFLGNLGNAFLQQGQLGRAIECYVGALHHQPEDVDLRKRLATVCERQLDLGIEHQKSGRLAEAEACYQDVLRGQPERADAWHLLGTIALEGGEFETAEKHIGRAITLAPDIANFHNSLGGVYQKQRRYLEAIACYQHALHVQPDMVNAHSNLGQVYQAGHQWADAEASYRQALELRPDFPDAHYHLGRLLKEIGRTTDAEAAYRTALAFKPGYLDVYFALGELCYGKNRHMEALACFEQVLGLNSDYPFLHGSIAKCRANICEWTDHTRASQQLREGVRQGIGCVTPFVFLNVSDDPLEQRQCAEMRTQEYCSDYTLGSQGPQHSHNTIRLAYVSPDFRQHPIAHLISDLIEHHDRSRFQVFGVSIGPASNDPCRQRLVRGFDQFLDVRTASDEAVARRLRELDIDIAVDLAGYTTFSRPGIFAGRAAPIQVNYLGFPGTMGAEFMDYLLADRFVIPEELGSCYTEQVVYLPDTFQCASRREIAKATPSRQELGLPKAGVVFCCFNNSYKIHPELFDIWMRLLAQVEGSVLWLFKANESAEDNLRREAEAREVSPDRLVFAPRMPLAQHLARYRQADLFLDTLPYNAHTTASDALWAGLPVLTCRGQAFAGRVAGSLLQAIGLPELITTNLADYEALALRLATHPGELVALKQKLAVNRDTHSLFDVDRFRRHIEAAYQAMWERWQRGEPPAAFAVDPIGGRCVGENGCDIKRAMP
ncbi:MAG: tetratricopeptide repeat protein [Candidatus Krumholzibacteria bacterium]|nr:tetratricopeptide repeat protein [Candidatus Krumholzibacteria bacterium]MDH5271259.1 tetratricopeptide repeat protein [Candidatus Krumholzibacteria bacterium]